MYKKIVKPIFFKMDPETAHHMTIGMMRKAGRVPLAGSLLRAMYDVKEMPELEVELFGTQYKHPVGLAAGLDKNGEAVKAFSSVGLSHIEVGTVTPLPQPGNELPRLYRLPEDDALINRMGFNNEGTEAMASYLEKATPARVPIWVNIGKNKVTPNEQATDDYRKCIQDLYSLGDVFVINISSPNTPDLRKLQHGAYLTELLEAATDEMKRQAAGQPVKPIILKISPDLTNEQLNEIIESVMKSGVSGIMATNTTISRDESLQSSRQSEPGGLSGKPLATRSTEVIHDIYKLTEGKLPIIGCGGVFTGQDAYDKICAGASLIQIYTSMIYHGPAVTKNMAKELLQLLRRDGHSHIQDAVGTSVRL